MQSCSKGHLIALCVERKYNNGKEASDHIKCILCPSGKHNNIIGGDNIDKCDWTKYMLFRFKHIDGCINL